MAKKPETKPTPSKAVAVKTEAAVPQGAVPDYLKGKTNRAGVVGYRPEDLIIPRLDLMQDISPGVQDGDYRSGEFVHNVLEESLGKEVEVVVILARKQYMLWKPRHDGGGILARADDGVHWSPANKAFEVKPHKGLNKKVTWRTADTVEKSGLHLWGSTDPEDPDSQPAANEMATLVVLLTERPELGPVVITLQRGSLKVGRKIVQRLMFSTTPITALKFLVSTERASNDAGDGFWTYKFTANGFVEDENLYNEAERYQKRFLEMGFQIKGEEELQDGAADSGGAGSGKTYDV